MRSMKITPIAATRIINVPDSIADTQVGDDLWHATHECDGTYCSDIDILHEAAGRGCYKSWDKPNPATQDNDTYLHHIIESAHVSVMEHGQVTFYVEHVSRSLLLELERHGRNSHLSFSVESQRYVNTGKHHPEPVIPPMFKATRDVGIALEQMLRAHYEIALARYDTAYNDLREAGVPVKQAREAARAFLPNATPVDFMVTADIRAWREVIEKRDADGADAEIREFAQEIERHLTYLAPNSMQKAA